MSSVAMAMPTAGASIWWHGAGASRDAEAVRNSVATAFAHLFTTIAIGETFWAVDKALVDLEQEAALPNWNSRGADAVDPGSLVEARRFLTLMPSTYPRPDVSVDPDGQVAFEWEGAADTLFSISFGPDRVITYAGLFGINRVRGAEFFGDEIPTPIAENLRRSVNQR